MCLVVLAVDLHPRYRLVLAANRDEFHRRPASDLSWWDTPADVIGGRDLAAGGTWLAMHRHGRFATVTNYREHRPRPASLMSRGKLITDFITGNESAASWSHTVDGTQYAGFNLIVIDSSGAWHASNRAPELTDLAGRVHGLANAELNAPWPKVERAKSELTNLLQQDQVDDASLFQLLSDRQTASTNEHDAELPADVARALSAAFVIGENYGTRCSTVLTWSHSGDVHIAERRFDSLGRQTGESTFDFPIPAG